MKYSLTVLATFLAVFCSCSGESVKVGVPLPAWQEGEMDIHFINTGRGECTWQIMPDGTTFLVDASGSLLKFGVEASDPLPSKPSDDLTAGKVVVDYINHFSPAVSAGHVNYFMLTHHHPDHMGSLNPEVPYHESGLFQLSSITEIGSSLVFDTILDRDYPAFSYPTPESQDSRLMHNYEAFLDWTAETNGSKIEQWNVGSCSQVVPVHNPDCGVSVRNFAGNGRFWTGEGEENFTLMPTTEEFEAGDPKAIPTENCYSCAYILTFGDFDFFAGGDLQYNDRSRYAYKDAETPLTRAGHKVEVMKANHHGTLHTQDPGLMAVLCPDVWVCSNWRDVQPRPITVDTVLEANPDCDIYCTNMPEVNKEVLGEERLEKMASQCGHVVVRVAPDGKSYMVYVLDDNDEQYIVKSVHGPYQCAE